jgi:hypothetical protein
MLALTRDAPFIYERASASSRCEWVAGWQLAGSYLTASLIMQMTRIVNPNTFKLEWKCSDYVG